jgi:hypothetical protein
VRASPLPVDQVSFCEVAQLCREDALATMEIFPELKVRINMFRRTGRTLSTKGRCVV